MAAMSSEQIKAARLAPAVTVAVPPKLFKAFGIAFSQDEDDLDSYEFAGVLINRLPFGLLQYQHAPSGETTLLLPEGATIETFVAEFAKEFDLAPDLFHWRDIRQATPA